MEIILGSIKDRNAHGVHFKFRPAEELRIWPCIPISSSDYEEQGFYTLTKGSSCKSPCPVCLIPLEKLSDHSQCYTARTTETMRALCKENDKDTLQAAGLRNVENFFWDLNHSDPYLACSYDRLHAAIGLFHHLFLELQLRVKRLGRNAQTTVDEQMASFPRWSRLPHFNHVMETTFTDGSKEEAIAKQIGFCALNVLTKEKDPNGWLLLRCIHAFRRFNMYTALTQHTTETIRKGRLAAIELSKLIQEYGRNAEADLEGWPSKLNTPRTSWNFPKAHTYMHAFDDIMNKGAAPPD